MRLERLKELRDKSFPDVKIDDESVRRYIDYAKYKGRSDSVRVAMGKVILPSEYEQRRKRVLTKPLP